MNSPNQFAPKPAHLLLSGLLLLLSTTSLSAQQATATPRSAAVIVENRGQIVDNEGTVRHDIKYVSSFSNSTVYFTDRGATFILSGSADSNNVQDAGLPVSLMLAGANTHPRLHVEDQMSMLTNYYLAHCPDGITGVRSWRRLVYEDVYPDIDLVFAVSGGRMNAEFVVGDNGRAEDIHYYYNRLGDEVNSAQRTFGPDASSQGAEQGVYTLQIPQRIVMESGEKGLQFGSAEEQKPLLSLSKGATEDPTIAWATYIGGSLADYGTNVAGDISGNVVVTGYTVSTNFPATSGAYQTSNAGPYDVFVAKFDRFGTPIWITYYGGPAADVGNAVAIDANSDIVVGGQASDGFPVSSGAFQSTYGGVSDGFALKLNSNGTRLWATFYGGSKNDQTHNLAIDPSGNIVLSGRTASLDFPVSANAFQKTYSGTAGFDAFLVKLNGNGARVWATYYGGTNLDYSYGVAADSSGNIYLAGTTTSDDLPVSAGAFQMERADSAGVFGATDGFLIKFDGNGTRQWATYLGGRGDDFVFDIAADRSGNVVLIGSTVSTDFPVTEGAMQSTLASPDSSDAFVIRFDGSGSRIWATYFGGTRKEDGSGVAIGSNGGIVIAGNSSSTDLVTSSTAVQKTNGGGVDMFIAQISSSGDRQWSSYFGGTGNDRVYIGGVGIDTAGSLLMTGYVTGSGFPVTPEPFQSSYGGGDADGVVVKLAIPIVNPPGAVPVINEAVGMVAMQEIAPNPARDMARLHFRLAVPQQVRIAIYGADGTQLRVPVSSELLGAGEHLLAIDLQGLASGSYLVELSTPRGRSVAPLMIVQ